MWFERYVIVVTSLSKDFLPSSWAEYHPTIYDKMFFIGTLGIFFMGILLFFRFIPMMAISELKGILKETSLKKEKTHGKD
jgi:molybdopterin-containing oxidoreductase family membrane subunit